MNKEEIQARKVCAFCNWVKECEDCPHREWSSGKWHKKPRWDYLECQEWRYYLKKWHEKLIRRIRRFLKIHKWYTSSSIEREYKIIRKCTICEKEQEYISNKDYTKGKWINID